MSGLLEPILERPGERAPDVGIVMPIRNSESRIAVAVRSVLEQSDCVADILISDDQSTDRTLAGARHAIEGWRGPHRVRLFRTARRLAIDHLPTLVGASGQDFLVQMHGDDEQLPGRAATQHEIHRRTGASLVSTVAIQIRGATMRREVLPPGVSEGLLPPATIAAGTPVHMLSGSRLALDRRLYDAFPPLDSAYLSIGHDILKSWRALLLGGVWIGARPLLAVHWHEGQWSNRLWDTRRPESTAFASHLHRLAVLRALRRDLAHVAAQGTVPAERVAEIRRLSESAWDQAIDRLLDAREALHRQGLEPAWTDLEDLLAMKRRAAAQPRG
ncbi:glycosyltransferase [Stella sp.]|uniref:glycosyltransferase n=1 Tax=Stella sp. TaxID=2912054 RepID=UPI0035B07752